MASAEGCLLVFDRKRPVRSDALALQEWVDCICPGGSPRSGFGKGQCHANAGWLARRWPERYEWWTGYAQIPKFGGFDNHSWVRVVDGPHVEVTYDTPSLFYVGVRVPPSLFSRLREDSSFQPNERVALEALGYDARHF